MTAMPPSGNAVSLPSWRPLSALTVSRRNWALGAAWKLCLLLMPVTSPVCLGGAGGSIRPLSTIPAMLALPLVLWAFGPRLWSDKSIRWVLLAAFGIMACGLILAVADPGSLGGSLRWGWYCQGAASLFVGLAYYLLARERLRTPLDVEAATPWILWGMTASVALAFLQLLSIQAMPSIRSLTVMLSDPFSSTYAIDSIPHNGRGHGLAYEPSYLASQLILTVLPLGGWLLARGRNGLGLSCVALATFGCMLSGSRMGILSCVIVVPPMLIFVGIVRNWRTAAIAAACAATCLIAGMQFIKNINYVTLNAKPSGSVPAQEHAAQVSAFRRLVGLAERTNTIPRAASLYAAGVVFTEHPVLGGGLGSGPLLLPKHFPDWSLHWLEVQAWCSGEKPAKPLSLWARILAETGVVGFALIAYAIYRHFPMRILSLEMLALAPFLLAMFLDGFSLASFALIGPWLCLAVLGVNAPRDDRT